MKFKIKAFKADEHLELCVAYKRGHIKVLEDYGITNVTSNNDNWFHEKNVYVLVVSNSETEEIVGGARLHIYDAVHNIPIQNALGDLDPGILLELELAKESGTGEACGLWNAKKAWGLGLGALLTTAIVAFSPKVGIKSLFALSAKYTKEMIASRGFQILTSVGEQGDFVYPIESHRATVMKYYDLEDVSKASEYERERILSLRENPNQTFLEQINGRSILIEYNLSVLKIVEGAHNH